MWTVAITGLNDTGYLSKFFKMNCIGTILNLIQNLMQKG
jgi:hypothetical protein